MKLKKILIVFVMSLCLCIPLLVPFSNVSAGQRNTMLTQSLYEFGKYPDLKALNIQPYFIGDYAGTTESEAPLDDFSYIFSFANDYDFRFDFYDFDYNENYMFHIKNEALYYSLKTTDKNYYDFGLSSIRGLSLSALIVDITYLREYRFIDEANTMLMPYFSTYHKVYTSNVNSTTIFNDFKNSIASFINGESYIYNIYRYNQTLSSESYRSSCLFFSLMDINYYFKTSLSYVDTSFNLQVSNYNGNYRNIVDNFQTDITHALGVQYSLGYEAGVDSANNFNMLTLLGAVVDAPVSVFKTMFNFDFLGFNLLYFVEAIFSIMFIVLIVKLIVGGK